MMYASNKSRNLIERLVRALKTQEREDMARLLGIPHSMDLPNVLRQQIMMIELGENDPIKFCGALTLVTVRKYGKNLETVNR